MELKEMRESSEQDITDPMILFIALTLPLKTYPRLDNYMTTLLIGHINHFDLFLKKQYKCLSIGITKWF